MTSFRLIFVTVAAVVAMILGTAKAQDLVAYQSKGLGLNVAVPSYMNLTEDNKEILLFQSDNLVFSIHPIPTEKLTDDGIAEMISGTVTEAGMDIKKAQTDNLKTNTMTGSYVIASKDGVNLIVGMCAESENAPVAYLFTITFADDNATDAGCILGSIEK